MQFEKLLTSGETYDTQCKTYTCIGSHEIIYIWYLKGPSAPYSTVNYPWIYIIPFVIFPRENVPIRCRITHVATAAESKLCTPMCRLDVSCDPSLKNLHPKRRRTNQKFATILAAVITLAHVGLSGGWDHLNRITKLNFQVPIDLWIWVIHSLWQSQQDDPQALRRDEGYHWGSSADSPHLLWHDPTSDRKMSVRTMLYSK